jgi:hypothetical protein
MLTRLPDRAIVSASNAGGLMRAGGGGRNRQCAAAVAALALALGVGACSGSTAGTSSGTSTPGSRNTLAKSLGNKDLASLQISARVESARVERELMTLSGLEAALGGPAAADRAYAKLTDAMQTATVRWRAPAEYRVRVIAARVQERSAADVGGLIFQTLAGLIFGSGSLVESSNALEPGKSLSQPLQDFGTVTASIDKVQLDLEKEVTGGELTGKATVHLDMVPCPDAMGSVVAIAKATSSTTMAGGHGSRLAIDIKITGHVNDDAELTSYDFDSRTGASMSIPGGKAAAMEMTSKGTMSQGHMDGRDGLSAVSGNWTQQFLHDQQKLTEIIEALVGNIVTEAAASGWKSGRCVSLDPTTAPAARSGMTPSAMSTITAQPKSKIDGWPVGGTVKATLSGAAGVEPADKKVLATARFTYTAPDKKDKSGTVALEARSKRGVARADVSFDTNAGSYLASGGADEFHGTGTICSLAQPFTIEGSGVTMSFTPSSDKGGTYTYRGSMQGFEVSGKGTYTVTANDKGGTITATGEGSVKTPMGTMTASGTETNTLTPTNKCR